MLINDNSSSLGVRNVGAAESLIRDIDYASASARMTKTQILTQSSNAVQAQANLLPEGVVGLL